LAKLDEEVELDEHVYKLGTNEYLTNVISPDGHLYLQQVSVEGALATFSYEAGRFRLTKQIWMDEGRATTFVRYELGQDSSPVRLTLLPLCDHRPSEALTSGSEAWHFQVENEADGLKIVAHADAIPYRILTHPPAAATPLDLWYWRFQLRSDDNAGTDLYLPGLLRADLTPGGRLTVIATCESGDVNGLAADRALERARAAESRSDLPAPDRFTPDLFLSTEP
jgi:predicted glycogen debranching enzyme